MTKQIAHTYDQSAYKPTGQSLENGDISRMARNETFLELLRGLSFDKIDFATAHLLSHWDSLSGGDEVRQKKGSLPSK